MSKLTDKIELLVIHGDKQTLQHPMNIDRLRAILADVREMESRLEFLDRTYRVSQPAHEAALRAAKREAYEHALSTVEANETQGGAAYSVKAAIDALDTEGNSDE